MIEYDKPIEVNKSKLDYLRKNLGGVFAWRFDGQKYWIKTWMMKYAPLVEKILNSSL